MSTRTAKADIHGAVQYVRLVPIADIAKVRQFITALYAVHLQRPGELMWQCPRCLHEDRPSTSVERMLEKFLTVVCLAAVLSACGGATLSSQTGAAGPPVAPVLQDITVNGVNLHYMKQGDGDPVVFVHGTTLDYRSWNSQVEVLSESYQTIAYSRRYAYPNELQEDAEDFSIGLHAKDLAAFLDSLKLGPVHLVGHSFGAFVSLLVARDRPDLVRSLTLGEPPAYSLIASTQEGSDLLQNFQSTFVSSGQAFTNGDEKEGTRLFLTAVLGQAKYESLTDDYLSLVYMNLSEVKGTLRDRSAIPQITCEDAAKVRVPTLLLAGQESREVFKRVQDSLASCIPNNERAEISGATHGLQIDNPTAFNEAILAFFAKH